jgi:serine/threonine protein phosphatase 1
MLQRLFGAKAAENCHAQLPMVDPLERIYAVGDIHGRHDLLAAMLELISTDIMKTKDNRRNRIVFMGDYIDRGDHSREVLDSLAEIFGVNEELERRTGTRFDFLSGNHEVALLRFLEDPVRGSDWLSWGGRQTLASFGIVARSNTPDDDELKALRDQFRTEIRPHLDFLTNLSKMVVSGGVVFVHAGLDPEFPLAKQPDAAAFWGQNPSGKKSGLPGYRMVHGHVASYEPVSIPERICVDTGAYYSGRLTAVRLDRDETFLHVDAADLMA